MTGLSTYTPYMGAVTAEWLAYCHVSNERHVTAKGEVVDTRRGEYRLIFSESPFNNDITMMRLSDKRTK